MVRGHAGLSDDRVAERGLLPVAGPLRGRDADLARLLSLLGAAGHAPIVVRSGASAVVVTLWGPGGIGKTSLAVAAAHALRSGGSEAIFVPLSGDVELRDVVRSVGAALGASATRAKSPIEGVARLGAVLARRGDVVVVLDNAEPCIGAVAELVVRLRASAPRARLLVTSREPLGIADETIAPVAPLALSAPDGDPRTADAVALLLERARAVRPDFDAPTPVLAELARMTEGIPLAIELCAARLDVLSASELALRLAKGRGVLRSPRRDIDERHRTLFASIAMSFRLLADDDRDALVRLASFAGPFDVEAAEQVLAESSGIPALDRIASLVRKSLLRREAVSSRAGESYAPVRIAFYDAVRAFVREVAAAPDGEGAPEESARFRDALVDAERRHARTFAARGAAFAARVDGEEGGAAIAGLARIEPELDVIVARFVDGADPALAADAARAILAKHPLAVVRGPLSGFTERARALLGVATVEGCARGRIERALGTALLFSGKIDEARTTLEHAAEHLARDGSVLDVAEAEQALGDVLAEGGDYPASTLIHWRALARTEVPEDSSAIGPPVAPEAAALAGLCFSSIGRNAHMTGDLAEAGRHYERAVVLLATAGHARGQARVQTRLGFLAYDRQRTDEARRWFGESLRISERLGDERIAGYATGYLGNTLRAEDAIDAAIVHYERAMAVMERIGDRLYEAIFRMDLAIACLLDRRVERATTELANARRILRDDLGAHQAKALVAGYYVCALAYSGRYEEARLVAADALAMAGDVNRVCLETHMLIAAILEHGDEVSLAAARERLATRDSLPSTEHVRLSTRLLARLFDQRCPPESAIVVRGAAVSPPRGDVVDLSARPTLAAIVRTLLDARRASPGKGVASASLVAAAWPGEKVLRNAAAIRVRVAIAQLRKLGFADVLRSGGGGYFLDPSVPLVERDD